MHANHAGLQSTNTVLHALRVRRELIAEGTRMLTSI